MTSSSSGRQRAGPRSVEGAVRSSASARAASVGSLSSRSVGSDTYAPSLATYMLPHRARGRKRLSVLVGRVPRVRGRSLLLLLRLADEAVDAVLARVVLAPLLRLLGQRGEGLRLLPTVLLRHAQGEEEGLRVRLGAGAR